MGKRLEINIEPKSYKAPRPKKRKLTTNEKNILYAIVKYPSSTDSDLSSITGLPRPSISQTRRKLIQEGLLYTKNMPYLLKLRSELISFSHIAFDSGNSPLDKKAILDSLKKY